MNIIKKIRNSIALPKTKIARTTVLAMRANYIYSNNRSASYDNKFTRLIWAAVIRCLPGEYDRVMALLIRIEKRSATTKKCKSD